MSQPARTREMTTTGLCAALALAIALGACSNNDSTAEYERQLKACSLAEGNGLLDSAVLACETALRIADEQAYAPERRSSLLFTLGRLERQRGNFKQAESLVRRSLAIEESPDGTAALATRLVELSLILAGEDRWVDGAELLDRATPLLDTLTGQDRLAAANAFRGYSLRLEVLGLSAQAAHFRELARQLKET